MGIPSHVDVPIVVDRRVASVSGPVTKSTQGAMGACPGMP
jgi:hypothetical protein